MGDYICWLVTVLHQGSTLKCALKIKRDALPKDCLLHPMEPENRQRIHAWLPSHVKSCGPVVAVEEIFEVEDVDATADARRMRWMLDGHGYFMEENCLCGHGRCHDGSEQNAARATIDMAIAEDVWGK